MKRRNALKLSLAAGAGLLVSALPARACRVFPADEQLEFEILRAQHRVGWHRIGFSRATGVLVVRSDSDLILGAAPSPAYRFAQHVEETWRDGWLSGLVADTNDDGVRWKIRAERDAQGIFTGIVNGLTFTVSGYAIPSSLWHRDTPRQEALLDLVDAQIKLVRSRLVGREGILAGGRTVTARHYELYGELRRSLWYDDDCRLVRAAIPGRDGTLHTLRLV